MISGRVLDVTRYNGCDSIAEAHDTSRRWWQVISELFAREHAGDSKVCGGGQRVHPRALLHGGAVAADQILEDARQTALSACSLSFFFHAHNEPSNQWEAIADWRCWSPATPTTRASVCAMVLVAAVAAELLPSASRTITLDVGAVFRYRLCLRTYCLLILQRQHG